MSCPPPHPPPRAFSFFSVFWGRSVNTRWASHRHLVRCLVLCCCALTITKNRNMSYDSVLPYAVACFSCVPAFIVLFLPSLSTPKQAYCEVEVMKMYMPLCVRESGVVRWHLSEGAALKPGDRLATLELDDPSAVTRAEVCLWSVCGRSSSCFVSVVVRGKAVCFGLPRSLNILTCLTAIYFYFLSFLPYLFVYSLRRQSV